ncbi:Hypothetical protein, putative [Bodo saltans]|uniref:Uncharacterized protein n=1 Tax=Bodo saltans TaxID=75058 RepID=A0A0S4J5G5_BODSA|nr:Hypothetical protein, putative [Bodo saltans]|eukprot:CUG83736.1 Hypothetical protein, putative [Bodo saltans]
MTWYYLVQLANVKFKHCFNPLDRRLSHRRQWRCRRRCLRVPSRSASTCPVIQGLGSRKRGDVIGKCWCGASGCLCTGHCSARYRLVEIITTTAATS